MKKIMIKRFLFILVLTMFSVTLVLAQDMPVKTLAKNVSETSEIDRSYQIGPGDVVTAKVFGEPEFDFAATVDQNGKIETPVSETPITAMCRTENQLRAEVKELISKYLKNPMVTVQVTERNSRRPAVVSGEVRQPQQVEMRRKASLLEILAFAGGVNEDAGGIVRVYRTQPPLCEEPGTQVAWTKSDSDYEVPSRLYTLSSIQSGDELSNPTIYPGDLIVVEKASPVYITGEVIAPQGLRIPEGGLSLSRAIAMVSGVRREAKTKDVRIYRLKQDSQDREIISANYDMIKKGEQKDIMLEPYDIVEVDKSKKSVGQIILETVVGAAKTSVGGFGATLPTRILY